MGVAPSGVWYAAAIVGLALMSPVIAQWSAPVLPPQAVRWVADVDYRVGGDTAQRLGLTRITDLLVGKDGRIYVLDSVERELHILDSQRERQSGVVGRRGGGPGEFENPTALGWWGDMLWVFDTRLLRLSLFTSEGEFIRSRRIYWPGDADETLLSVVGAPGEGTLLVIPRITLPPDDSYPRWLPILRLGSDAEAIDTPAILSLRNQFLKIQHRGGHSFRNQPFADGTLWDVAANGESVVLVEHEPVDRSAESEFQVTKLTSSGDTVFTRRFSYKPRRFSQSEINATVSSVSESLGRWFPSEGAARKAVRSALYLPIYHRPATAVILGRDGTIWLREETTPDSDSVLWTVLDGTGNRIGELQLPTGTRVLEADSEFVWGSETTSLGVPYVVRFRLGRTAVKP